MEAVLTLDELNKMITGVFNDAFDDFRTLKLPEYHENIHDRINSNADNIMPCVKLQGVKGEWAYEHLFLLSEYNEYFLSNDIIEVLTSQKEALLIRMNH